jgi:hypothetical protein
MTKIGHFDRLIPRSILLALTCATVFQFTALAQSPEASTANYNVYSAFLKAQLDCHNGIDDIRVGDNAAVLAPVTITFNAASSPRRDAVKEQINGLQNSTFESFLQCQADSVSISHSFSMNAAYDVASRDDVSSVEKFLSRYPENRCLVSFSCVGFNPDESQAFFITERSVCHSGVQKYVLMEKDRDGQWLLKSAGVDWIQ